MQDIREAFKGLEPDKATADELYNRILVSSFAPAFKSNKKKKITMTKKTVIYTACACIIATGVVVSTCSALVLNVNKHKKSDTETTETVAEVVNSENSENNDSSENNENISEIATEEETESETTVTETETEPVETKNTKETSTVTVNGREYIIATTESATTSDGRLHASNTPIQPRTTEKTEATTKKTSAATKVQTTVLSSETPVNIIVTERTEAENATEATTVVTNVPTEEIATFVWSTSVVTDISSNVSETTENEDPNIFCKVSYNGNEYVFHGSSRTNENLVNDLGLYPIMKSDYSASVMEEVFYVDDSTLAVKFNSTYYIYTK